MIGMGKNKKAKSKRAQTRTSDAISTKESRKYSLPKKKKGKR